MSPSVAELKALEASLQVDRADAFNTFGARMENAKTGLASKLESLKAAGKTIAGYGASVGSTILMFNFDLGEMLSFIVDDNPSKHNLYSPGHHIPVLPSQAIYEKMPDYVLILAWRYAEPIMKKNQAYLDQGGHFIIPLPQVEII